MGRIMPEQPLPEVIHELAGTIAPLSGREPNYSRDISKYSAAKQVLQSSGECLKPEGSPRDVCAYCTPERRMCEIVMERTVEL